MRQRVEDLGRIAVLLDNVMELDVWDAKDQILCRNKDFEDIFYDYEEEKQREILRSFLYGLEEICELLFVIKEIAYGEDYKNEPSE